MNAILVGYRLVDKQIVERGTSIARNLRGAVERAGGGLKAVDASEEMLKKVVVLLQEWLQTLTQTPAIFLKRFSHRDPALFGGAASADPIAWIEAIVEIVRRQASETNGTRSADTGAAPPKASAPTKPEIEFEGEPRYVELTKWSFKSQQAPGRWDISFRNASTPSQSIEGRVEYSADGIFLLVLKLTTENCGGTWKAPICDEHKRLLGTVIIDL